MSTKQILDRYYNPSTPQIVMMAGVTYRHEIDGDWYIVEE